MTRSIRDPINRRGNTTSGKTRRGNRNGRPPILPQDDNLTRTSLRLTLESHALLLYLGEGSITRGVDRAAQALKPLASTNITDVMHDPLLVLSKIRKARPFYAAEAKALVAALSAVQKPDYNAVHFAKLNALRVRIPDGTVKAEAPSLADLEDNGWDDLP